MLALSGCSGLAGFLGDDEDGPKPAKLEAFEPVAKIKSLWSRRAASGEGGLDLELRAVLAEGRVFAAGHDGDVAAFDPFTGKPLWQAETGVSISSGPGAGPGLVVVGGSGGDVVALSSADGAVAWRARVTSEVLAAPAVGERIVAVRTVDGKLFGLDAATGERSWVYDRTVPVLTLRGTGAPVIAGDVVVAGFDSGHLVAISLTDGTLLWEFHVAAPTGQTELERLADMDADPVVANGVVYAVTFQGRVAAIDLRTGIALWQRDMSSHAGMGIGQRLLYVTDEQSHVWAFDRGTGASLWRQDGLERRGVTPAGRARGLRRRRGLPGLRPLAQHRRRPLRRADPGRRRRGARSPGDQPDRRVRPRREWNAHFPHGSLIAGAASSPAGELDRGPVPAMSPGHEPCFPRSHSSAAPTSASPPCSTR